MGCCSSGAEVIGMLWEAPVEPVAGLNLPKSAKRALLRRVGEADGQTSSEYMLVLSVVTVSVASAAYTFVPTVQNGVETLAKRVQNVLKTQDISTANDLGSHWS